MNTNKAQSEVRCSCSILSNYESILKEQQQTPELSNLREVKLKILKKLMNTNKCPAGHVFQSD